MDANSSTLLVGRIGGAYGIKGWVKISSFTEPPENILSYAPWLLYSARGAKMQHSVELLQGKAHGKVLIAQLAGVDDRDQAEQLRGLEIRVPREQLPLPEIGQFYWADLEGLRVTRKDGVELGRVDQLLDTGTADVMVIVGEGRHLIPFVYGETVLQVDLDAGCIEVDWDTDAE